VTQHAINFDGHIPHLGMVKDMGQPLIRESHLAAKAIVQHFHFARFSLRGDHHKGSFATQASRALFRLSATRPAGDNDRANQAKKQKKKAASETPGVHSDQMG
jgi:hypothetical protein